MTNKNIVAQILAVLLFLIGMYLVGITLITIYGALLGRVFMLLIITIPMLIVGALMLIFSYRVIFKPSEKNNKSIAKIYAVITLLYSGTIIESMIPENDIIINPRVVASGSTIILAILVYYGIKVGLNIGNQNNTET